MVRREGAVEPVAARSRRLGAPPSSRPSSTPRDVSLHRRRHHDRHQRGPHPQRAHASLYLTTQRLRGHPVHPADQPQVPLRLRAGASRRRSCGGATASASPSGSTPRGARRAARRRRGAARPCCSSTAPRADGGVAVAVCFLFSYLNPEHELAVREAARRARPDVPVSLSHEIAPIWREYERGTAAILDAYLKPAIERYVAGVDEALAAQGVGARWSLLKSNGGHALARRRRASARRTCSCRASPAARSAGRSFTRAGGAPRRRRARHGRHELRRLPGARRRAAVLVGLRDRVRPAGRRAEREHADDRRRRRLDRLDRSRRLPAGRPAERGRRPGPRLLRPRRRGADAHRRQRRARPPRPRTTSWRRLPSTRTPRADAALDRLGDALGRDRVERRVVDAARRQREHGQRRPHRHRRAGRRPARARAGRVRRRRPDPRRRDRRRDRTCDACIVPPQPGLCSAFGALAAPSASTRSERHPDRRSDVGRGARRPVRRRSRRARGELPAQGSAGAEPEVRRSIAMRYQGQNYEQEVAVPDGAMTPRGAARGLRRYHAPLRGVLRLPARGDPDRARAPQRRRARRAARAAGPAERGSRRRRRAARRRPRRLLPRPRLRADAGVRRERAGRRRGARRAAHRESWTRPSWCRPAWTLGGARRRPCMELVRRSRRREHGRSIPSPSTIINNNFVNICREMGITMMRTAFSPIFNEGLDFSCVLFDRRRQHDRPGRVLPGPDRGEPLHRPLDGRGARRRRRSSPATSCCTTTPTAAAPTSPSTP